MAAKTFKKICLTGGPGAGKTSLLDILSREFSREFVTVQESATVLYRGGFPRASTPAEMKCVQEAIYHTQIAAEAFAKLQARSRKSTVCDRGTLDGAAYWPGSLNDFVASVGSGLAAELARYDLVIHMQSPTAADGYDYSNAIRTESVSQARILDGKLKRIWSKHPHFHLVVHKKSFIEKVQEVLAIIGAT